jgi:O-antigen/teichoic acid export membrane protein
MLTRSAARGAGLTLAASLVGRIAAAVAQIVTGLFLVQEEFGYYASAIGLLTMAGLFRGGSIQLYLGTLAPSHRRFRTGTVFWVSMSLYLVGLVPLLIAAPAIADHLEAPSVVPLIWIITGTTLQVPFRSVLRSRLNTRFRFGAGAVAQVVNDSIVSILTIILAIVLHNAMALAIPVLVGGLVEVLLLFRMARPHRTDFVPRRRFVRPVLHQMRWLIGVSAMMSLWTSGDYAVAEFLVPTAILGGYYFGYQLAVQPGRLFNVSMMNVLVPVVRRVAHDPVRMRSALQRMLGLGGFAITLINVALLGLIEPVERLVWNGRWADVVTAVQILTIGLSFASLFNMATAPFMAERRYREALLCNGLRAVGIVGGAAIGSVVDGTVNGIAMWVSGLMTVSSLAGIAWIVRGYGVRAWPMLGHMMRCTIPVILAASAAAWAGSEALTWLGTERVPAAGATAIAGCTFAVSVVIALVAIPGSVRTQMFDLAPARIRRRWPSFLRPRPSNLDSSS